MKKRLIGASVAIIILAVPILYQGIYNFGSVLQLNDLQLILVPLALFGIAIWLGHSAFRNSLSEPLHYRSIIPVLVAIVASVLTLTLRGVIAFFNYMDCIRDCPTGTCGGATGTDPIYNCTFPFLEFLLPLAIIGIASTIIAAQRVKS